MRIRISHATTYVYDTPPAGVTQLLRKTPRNHDGQYVLDWRIDLSQDCLLHQHEDAFGNITHSFTAEGPFDGIVGRGRGRGRHPGHPWRGARHARALSAAALFLRETPLTQGRRGHHRIRRDRARRRRQRQLALLHALLARAQRRNDLRHRSDPHRHHRGGSLRAAARRLPGPRPISSSRRRARLGVPARYVGGHFYRGDGVTAQEAGHAWAEAYVENLGWVGFDPTNGICATDAHVRVAVGPRLSRRRAGARHPLRRRRRNPESRRACRPGRANQSRTRRGLNGPQPACTLPDHARAPL